VTGQKLDQGAFAASVGTDDAVKMACFEPEVQILENSLGAIREFDIFQIVHPLAYENCRS
jgi:hypothetical protein